MLKKTPLLVTTILFLLFVCSFITEGNETNLKTDVVVIDGGGAG